MRPKLSGRKEVIKDFIREYYEENDSFPSERDITAGTGIPAGSVHRFLVEMREEGELSSFEGRRSARTEQMDQTSRKRVIPVMGEVQCGEAQEEEEQFIEYIHLSEKLVGKGEFFALIARGNSMIDVGVHPGDYVIVRKQHTANKNDIVVALLDGRNNLKQLSYSRGKPVLVSRNQDKERYPDIKPGKDEELSIQGVAVGVYHSLSVN